MNMKVSKTVSLPLFFVERILDEMEITSMDFSATLVVVAKIGLAVRENARISEEQEMKDLRKAEEDRILKASMSGAKE